MNISNNFSTPAFKGIYVHDKNMSQQQKNLSSNVLRTITYSDEYQEADKKDIDVYITANTRRHNAVNVRYMDLDNGYYFRDKGKIIQTSVAPGEEQKLADRIITQLRNIVSGEYGFRGFDAFAHENKNSDLLKLRPDYFAEL